MIGQIAAQALYDACAEFVRKVESGEARSEKSYTQMKATIQQADEDEQNSLGE